jgi:peptide-methionine (R)-S-oxide reductase
VPTRRAFILLTAPGALSACIPRGRRRERADEERRRAALTGEEEARRRERLARLKKKTPQPPPTSSAIPTLDARLTLTDDEWRARLTPLQYEILRDGGTELAWTGRYLKNDAPGRYHCAACNNPLFDSQHKYDSRTGWPSFTRPTHPERVRTQPDTRHDMVRTEIVCAHCDGHLGHVFEDGPEPLGLRYCVNSVALFFRPGRAK